jgi:hypothetical protein
MDTNVDYFSYTDAHGTEVVVQRLNQVPEQYRSHVKHIDLSKPALTLRSPSSHIVTLGQPGFCLRGQATCFHWPSVVVGASVAFVLGMVAVVLVRRASRLFWFVIGLAAITVLSTSYLGYVRYQAGLSPAGLAGPGALIGDARRAARAVNDRNQEQERLIQDIDRQR